jgi:hypothetical protein
MRRSFRSKQQPWTFCIVSDFFIKENYTDRCGGRKNMKVYNGRMSDEWLNDLAPLQTDWQKPFLETAPYLIVVFRRSYEFEETHKHQKLLRHGKLWYCMRIFVSCNSQRRIGCINTYTFSNEFSCKNFKKTCE